MSNYKPQIMKKTDTPSGLSRILKPFEYNTTKTLLSVGIGGFLLLSYLAYRWSFISDGIVQMHQSPAIAGWKVLVNNAINTVALSILLYVLGRIIYRKTRLVDVCVAVLIAQLNLCVIAVLLLNPIQQATAEELVSRILSGGADALSLQATSYTGLIFLSIFSILFLFYFFYTLIAGMKIAMNTKKAYSGILVFVLTIGLDVALHLLNPYFG